jgi:hypothetical protein
MFVRVFLFVGMAVLIWSAYARPSAAHGAKRAYTVRTYDTLWSIATSHYRGDPRAAIWEIQRRNKLVGAEVRPGQKLVLP